MHRKLLGWLLESTLQYRDGYLAHLNREVDLPCELQDKSDILKSLGFLGVVLFAAVPDFGFSLPLWVIPSLTMCGFCLVLKKYLKTRPWLPEIWVKDHLMQHTAILFFGLLLSVR
jgi:hypothetical protein